MISSWVTTEVASALSLKVRTGQLTQVGRRAAFEAYQLFVVAACSRVQVTTTHFEVAAHYGARPDLVLRAGDALHIAVCEDRGATLLTLDRQMRTAALALGLDVEVV